MYAWEIISTHTNMYTCYTQKKWERERQRTHETLKRQMSNKAALNERRQIGGAKTAVPKYLAPSKWGFAENSEGLCNDKSWR